MLLGTPEVTVKLSLTADTYKRSASDGTELELVATITLANAEVITIETQGETDSGTILDDGFRMEHFAFTDLATGNEVVNRNPFPGTCDPHVDLAPWGVAELRSSQPLVTKQTLEDMSPLSDPVRQLLAGHEYRLTLEPQRVRCYAGTKADLFKGKESIPVAELHEAIILTLKSDDELKLKVEA